MSRSLNHRLSRIAALTAVGLAMTVSAPVSTHASPAISPEVGNPARGPDFDGDGYGDLAVGVPGEDKGAGAVAVVYGSPLGLTVSRSDAWNLRSSVGLRPARRDGFGSALAWGDFDGDGIHDLAIGVPRRGVPGTGERPGAVVVLTGSASGLTAQGSQLWTQDSPDVLGEASPRDDFGSALMGRDFDGDKIDDLAVGVPGADDPKDSGAVQVLYGSATGLTATGNQLIQQPISNPRKGEAFGYALGAGHLDEADLRFELLASAYDDLRGQRRAGAVTVMFGTDEGVSTTLVERWSQRTRGVLGAAERDDAFGRALAVADVDNDDNSELAVGVHESLRGEAGAGAVAVLYGTFTGLEVDRNELWSQNSDGVPDEAEPGDGAGNDVVLADFDNDGFNDLAVAVANEGVDDADAAGAVHILYGTAEGLDSARAQLFTQRDLGLEAAAGDQFGASLTRGDFNADKIIDLVIGVPGEGVGRGSIDVLYGTPAGLAPEAHQTLTSADLFGAEDWETGDAFGRALMAH